MAQVRGESSQEACGEEAEEYVEEEEEEEEVGELEMVGNALPSPQKEAAGGAFFFFITLKPRVE